MPAIKLRLPIPPSANNLYPSAGKRRVLSKEGQKFHQAVAYMTRNQLGPYEPLTGRIRASYQFHFANGHRRDIENYCKATSDALTNAKIWIDDSQLDHLTIIRGGVLLEPISIVTIEEM